MKRFRNSLTLVFIIIGAIQCRSQCIADAGNDISICGTLGFGTISLGGSPTAFSGTPPYTYKWTCFYKSGNSIKTASDFLDDTTNSNPSTKNPPSSPLTFYLTVKDNRGTTCSDSITLKVSRWGWFNNDNKKIIFKGDSVQLFCSLIGGILPITYLWSPSTGLTNPSMLNTWAKPDSTIIYKLNAVDAINCPCPKSDQFSVIVKPAGIDHLLDWLPKAQIYPNPMIDLSEIRLSENDPEGMEVLFYDLYGKLYKQLSLDKRVTEINRSEFVAGIYFYQVNFKNGSAINGKLVVK